jgi:hypothetical protein
MSSAITKGKIVMSPLSTGEKGVITSRPVTSRKILAHSHQCMKHQGHGLNTHPALQLLQGGGGVHGTRTTPRHGGLAMQVPAPPDREI